MWDCVGDCLLFGVGDFVCVFGVWFGVGGGGFGLVVLVY